MKKFISPKFMNFRQKKDAVTDNFLTKNNEQLKFPYAKKLCQNTLHFLQHLLPTKLCCTIVYNNFREC